MSNKDLKVELPSLTRKLSKLLINSNTDIMITEIPLHDEDKDQVVEKKFLNVNTSKESKESSEIQNSTRVIPK